MAKEQNRDKSTTNPPAVEPSEAGGMSIVDQDTLVRESVDLSEFVRLSQEIDPIALANELDQELEQSLREHRMPPGKLELAVSV